MSEKFHQQPGKMVAVSKSSRRGKLTPPQTTPPGGPGKMSLKCESKSRKHRVVTKGPRSPDSLLCDDFVEKRQRESFNHYIDSVLQPSRTRSGKRMEEFKGFSIGEIFTMEDLHCYSRFQIMEMRGKLEKRNRLSAIKQGLGKLVIKKIEKGAFCDRKTKAKKCNNKKGHGQGAAKTVKKIGENKVGSKEQSSSKKESIPRKVAKQTPKKRPTPLPPPSSSPPKPKPVPPKEKKKSVKKDHHQKLTLKKRLVYAARVPEEMEETAGVSSYSQQAMSDTLMPYPGFRIKQLILLKKADEVAALHVMKVKSEEALRDFVERTDFESHVADDSTSNAEINAQPSHSSSPIPKYQKSSSTSTSPHLETLGPALTADPSSSSVAKSCAEERGQATNQQTTPPIIFDSYEDMMRYFGEDECDINATLEPATTPLPSPDFLETSLPKDISCDEITTDSFGEIRIPDSCNLRPSAIRKLGPYTIISVFNGEEEKQMILMDSVDNGTSYNPITLD